MEIFNNQDVSGYDEIVSYGPKWWTEYREMDAVYKYAGWTLDLMAYFMERVVNNTFPSQADKYALEMYEKLFGIIVEEGETLEERRREVTAYYSGTGKLSKSVIMNLIKSYTGCKSELWWANDVLQIRIFLEDENKFSNNKVYNIISRRFPAYLAFSMREVLATFILYEYVLPQVKHRSVFSWWDDGLDGRYQLDRSVFLNAIRGPFFKETHRLISANVEDFPVRTVNKLADVKNSNTVDIISRQRTVMMWGWPNKIMDGNQNLDGSGNLDQSPPPAWTKVTHTMKLETEGDVAFTMYIPSKAAKLDGSRTMNGSINLNSGREEL